MNNHYHKNISNFFIAGINYKKSDACTRGQYAITNEQYKSLLNEAKEMGLNEIFVLSTCNRTEIYGFAHSCHELIQLLCSQTSGDVETYKKLSYIKSGDKTVENLYHIAAGLDSQLV